jgi:hypothetical protein
MARESLAACVGLRTLSRNGGHTIPLPAYRRSLYLSIT